MKVSVVIPTFNQATFLSDAVSSVVGQTFADWEILVVDDGSTDDTPEVLGRLADATPQLRWVRQSNSGRSAARNTGLGHAAGEYLVFLDSDDLLLPEKLERQVSYLDKHDEVGVVYADSYLCDERGADIQLFSLNEGQRHPSGMILDELLAGNFIQLTSAMVRRHCVEAVGGFDALIPPGEEDWELWVRIAARYQFHYLPEPLAKYRLHAGQTIQDRTRMMRAALGAREKISRLPILEEASPVARQRFYCTCGILELKLGNVQEGRRMFRRAMGFGQTHYRPYVLLALTFLGRLGFLRLVETKAWLRRVITRRAPSPIPHW